MKSQAKVIKLIDAKNIDAKDNVKMAEWTKDVLTELSKKLEMHIDASESQHDNLIKSQK